MKTKGQKWTIAVSLSLFYLFPSLLQAEWQRFRGENGAAISIHAKLPHTWTDTENIQWKLKLPGPGSSSPVISGDKVFVTAYSGYGLPSGGGGEKADLKRHLLCIDRQSGKVRWSREVDSVPEEDRYSRQLGEHGYASHTPVTDGKTIYAFFGKSGVFAYDLEGNQKWQTDVGRESGPRGWGSASSPILHGDKVIVTPSDEGLAIVALDAKTGKEVWKVESDKLENTYCTPVLAEVDAGHELIIVVPNEIWGFDPATGVCTWWANINLTRMASSSVLTRDGIVYITGGDSLAIRAGGKGDVSDSHILWTSRDRSGIPSPVLFADHLYYVTQQGDACCVDARTGKRVYREQLDVGRSGFYASLVLGGDKLYGFSRESGCFVFEVGPTFKLLAHNVFSADGSQFNSSPAIAGNQMFVRSNKYLYCIALPNQTVAKATY